MISIIPHQGARDITFGMTRAQVEKTVGCPPHRRAKLSDFDLSEIDFFEHFAVYYDARDTSCAIEFSRCDTEVSYDGYALFAHSPSDVRAWARDRDPELKEDAGFVSKRLGLSMHAPLIDEPDLDEEERAEPAQSFLVFRSGYYNEERERLGSTGLRTAKA